MAEGVRSASERVDEDQRDELATVTDRPTPRVRRARVTTEPGRSTVNSPPTTVASPIDALHRTEIEGTRNFCRIAIVLGLCGVAIVPVLPGNGVISILFECALVLALGGLGYLYRRTGDPATYYEGSGTAWGWYVPCLGVASAVPYFGPFSPVSVLLVLGIYFNSLGQRFRLSLACYLTCAIVQGVSGALVIAGIEDPGFIRADYLPLRVQIICQVLLQLVLLATWLVARGSRRVSLAALRELERAVRTVAQREAVIEEAREELRRAQGSTRGRFSEQVIGGYQLGEVIGRGAMGEVYEGVRVTSGEEVAVKMLSQASLANAMHVKRFMRELHTAATIASPNVVKVIEVGEQPLPYLVMERLRGRDLARILRGKQLLAHDRVVELIRQIGAGITAAAEVGVIHRDLKPQNVFLDGATWKILDFGVSRLADAGDTLTAGNIVGTPAYMAPEQARGVAIDHRADLYAVAAIAYRALTGHAPFFGGELADMLYRVVHTAPRRPSTLATLHADVDVVLAIGLAKRPDDRFATAADLARALELALSGTLDDATRARGQRLELDGAWARRP